MIKNDTEWARIKERGSAFGIKLLVNSYRYLGMPLFYILLFPAICYFYITASVARQASYQYLSKVFVIKGLKQKVHFTHVFKHFISFSNAALDKVSAWLGNISSMNVINHGSLQLETIKHSKKGALFVTSHLGNIELSRAMAEREGKMTLNALVFTQNALKFNRIVNELNPDAALNIIQVDSLNIDTVILLKQKIENGELVIIVGDRTPLTNTNRVLYAEFLGEPAPFAEGPWVLAKVLECPVYLLFCIKKKQQYHIYIEFFANKITFNKLNKQHILKSNIQAFATILQKFCLETPYQWYNFYNFWHSD